MRYRIVAVGKLKEPFYRNGFQHYLRRLSALAQCESVEVKEGAGDASAAKRAEGQALLRAAQPRVVALDESGPVFSTRSLAQHVSSLELAGHSRLTLLIGGAAGHGEELLSAVDERWSLSPLTFPHDLARLVLVEQLYRVETLRAGHPYHRD
ncbi:MAG: 23S rRNA (pseudouridine(1915)-N(3))-methyltransferase RlmH [Trueperaceae bacterium]